MILVRIRSVGQRNVQGDCEQDDGVFLCYFQTGEFSTTKCLLRVRKIVVIQCNATVKCNDNEA